jgi:hypothetical protein
MVGTSDTLDVMNHPEKFQKEIGRFCAEKIGL